MEFIETPYNTSMSSLQIKPLSTSTLDISDSKHHPQAGYSTSLCSQATHIHLSKDIPKQENNSRIDPIHDDNLALLMVHRFPHLTLTQRCQFLHQLLKCCDPSDMQFLATVIPMLHRDFITLLPLNISQMILIYIHPRDLGTSAQVSWAWNRAVSNKKLWEQLYGMIGLQSMVDVFFQSTKSVTANAKRLSFMSRWASGKFKYRSFQAHTLGILTLAFDGKYIGTGSTDKTCKISSVSTGECLRTLKGHDEAVLTVQFDKDKVCTGSADSTIRIWLNKDDGPLQHILTGHTGAVTCLKYVGNCLITGSEDKTIKIWDMVNVGVQPDPSDLPVDTTTLYRRTNDKHKDKNRKTAMHIIKSHSSFKKSDISLSDCGVAMDHNKMTTSSSVVASQKLSKPNGIVMSTVDRTTRASQSSCINIRTLYGHTGGIKSLDFHNGILISGDLHGIIKFWHIKSGNCVATYFLDHACLDAPLTLIDKHMGQSQIKTPHARSDPVSSLVFNDSRLLFGMLSGIVYLYDVHNIPLVSKIQSVGYDQLSEWASHPNTFFLNRIYHSHKSMPLCQKTSADASSHFEFDSQSSTANTCMVEHGAPKISPQRLNTNSQKVAQGKWSLCVRADDWRLMSAGSEGKCTVWNHRTGKMIYQLNAISDAADDGPRQDATLKLSAPVGRQESLDQEAKAATDSQSQPTDVCQTSTNISIGHSKSLMGRVLTGVAFDDGCIVASSTDGSVKIWDAK
ncbi:hypothetical protein QVD99_003719 [Batrachochytrium dendrobatidis]|nr:hypothetical protein QVD99_003719 [Batrachochytrium dendrobatidis]